MPTPEEMALAEIDRQRFAAGLGRIDRSSLQAQQAVGQAQAREEFASGLEEAETLATVRAQLAFETLRDAGLAGVAQQLRRAQRAAAFDAARRGVTGGSRQIERETRMRSEAQTQAGQVVNQAQQQANQQREEELAPLFRVQEQLEQPTSFQGAIFQGQLDRTADELGVFDAAQQRRNIELGAREGRAMNRAENLRGLFSSLGPTAEGLGERVGAAEKSPDTSTSRDAAQEGKR